MSFHRQLRRSRVLLALVIAPIVLACSGSTEPDAGCTNCGTGAVQIASATVSPRTATIARGGTATATVTYTASPNLRITAFHQQRQPTGITITQSSTQGTGNTIVRSYAIRADATVPLGTHLITLWITVDGATSTVQTTRAEFSLTVTQ